MDGSLLRTIVAAAATSAILTFILWRTALGRRILMDSPNERPLMDAAAKSSQIMPDAAATARNIQATRRVCVRTMRAAGLAEQEAASATTSRKTKVPVMTAVAAKCTPRTTTKGPSTPAPSQFIDLPRGVTDRPET